MGYINRERTQSAENVLRTWDLSGDRRIALAFSEDKNVLLLFLFFN